MKYTSKEHREYAGRINRKKQAEYDEILSGPKVTTWSATHKPDYSNRKKKQSEKG
nr:MAG TPA: hypothetical protein [Bacteriophage sp.]